MAAKHKQAGRGKRVRGSSSGRPIMRLLDALGRRWALRVLWELHRAEGTLNFRALRGACGGLSRTVLNERLRELRELGIIATADDGYVLSRSGRTLGRILLGLHAWAERNMTPGESK